MTVAGGGSRAVLRGLPGEVAEVIRRRPVAAAAPAALLGGGTDLLMLVRDSLGEEILVGIAIALAFELYVAYAELIVAEVRHDAPASPVGRLLRRALPLTPALVASSLIAVTVPLAAVGLLVLPALWLLTIWSLFAPAIVHEHLGPVQSLRRSAQLVRGAFWAVAASVTLSLLVEHTVIHGTAHEAEPALGSQALAFVGAGLATAIVSPPAAFTISLVYERLERRVRP